MKIDFTRAKAALDYSLHVQAPEKAPTPAAAAAGRKFWGASRRGLASSELFWFNRQLAKWKAEGRVTADGRLRVRQEPDAPWTLARVRAATPEANEWDRLAALILLDGVIEESDMDELTNVKEVVEGIADERLDRALKDPAHSEAIRALVRDEVSAMFGQLLVGIKRRAAPPAPDTPPRQNKCSKCGVPGHRAKTCQARGPLEKDKWACTHCANLKGTPLADTFHEVPPKMFHKDDPSYTEVA